LEYSFQCEEKENVNIVWRNRYFDWITDAGLYVTRIVIQGILISNDTLKQLQKDINNVQS